MSGLFPSTLGHPDPAHLAERLPADCRPHFRRLVGLPDEIRALVRFHQGAQRDALAASQAAEREIARLRSSAPPDPRLRAHTEARIVALIAEAERHRADADATASRAAPLRERASEAGRLAEALTAFVAAAPAGSLRLASAPPIPKGAALETVRAEIADLARQLEATRLASFPRAVVLERLAQEIDALARRGAPTVDPRLAAAPAKLARHVEALPGEFVAWALRDVIVARLTDLVPDLPDALDDDQRARRLADLAQRRLEAERLEEAVIRAAEAEGRVVGRRPNADPRAVLGVDGGGQ